MYIKFREKYLDIVIIGIKLYVVDVIFLEKLFFLIIRGEEDFVKYFFVN